MYVLHYFPDTASLAVRMVLAELGVQHRCQLIDRQAGALNSPEYRAMQPLGLIPALETPNGPMFETEATPMSRHFRSTVTMSFRGSLAFRHAHTKASPRMAGRMSCSV